MIAVPLMTARPTAIHIAMGFTAAPTLPQLKRYTIDSTRPLELRKLAMLEVSARTGKRITWLRSIADSKDQHPELRETARQWIAMLQTYRWGRARLRRLGLW
jgi:hypothetical protein